MSTTKLTSWRQFHDVVTQLLDFPHYAFRGHRMSNWPLEPSLARIIKDKIGTKRLIEDHLAKFQLASRGRRGTNPPSLVDENDWWALGQHHGLATPLLDWTTSPYVGLFFAFSDPPSPGQTEDCVVFAVNRQRIEEKNKFLEKEIFVFEEEFSFFEPLSDENSRLVAQSGLFSRCPIGIDVERWVAKYFQGEHSKIVVLKILIPHSERTECLKSLNVMNINHATLFPDLYGAGKHSTELLRRAADQAGSTDL